MGHEEQVMILIDTISKHPNLYDKRHPDYKNAMKKVQTWMEVAAATKFNCDVAKQKWKNLRDGYVKYLRSLSGPPEAAKRFEKWPWAKYLGFLDNVLKIPKPISKFEVIDHEIEDPVELKIGEVNDTEITEYVALMPPQKKLKSVPTKIEKITEHVDTNIYDTIPNSFNSKENKIKSDSDQIDQLFLNYAETFKKLSPRTQVVLKMEMAQMFGRAEISELDNNPSIIMTDPLK